MAQGRKMRGSGCSFHIRGQNALFRCSPPRPPGNFLPPVLTGPRQGSKRKQMVWPPEEGKCPGILGEAKTMREGKILKCRRSHCRTQLMTARFGLFLGCPSQRVYYLAREGLDPPSQGFRWSFQKAVGDSGVQQLGLHPSSSLTKES